MTRSNLQRKLQGLFAYNYTTLWLVNLFFFNQYIIAKQPLEKR